MANTRLSIQPVWGDRKLSTGVLETAENLMGNIDELADVLDNLMDQYNSVDKEESNRSDEAENNSKNSTSETTTEPKGLNMFRKLKTCLDSTRHLIDSLRSEKNRLMKREISVECKLGEIEDYKSHVKQDLSSLNELVDLLTIKVCDLEKELCEEQETTESIKCEKERIEDRLCRAEKLLQELNTDNENLLAENRNLAKERTDVLLKLDNQELNFQNEVLLVENAKLKEMLRDKLDTSEGDLGVTSSKTSQTERKQSLQNYLPDLIEDRSNNNGILINDETVCVRL